MSLRTRTMKFTSGCCETTKLKEALAGAEAVVIGAGAGLSVSAGYTYSGKRFEEYFGDFIKKYGFRDMYSAGFYPYETLEEYWGYWSRYIYVNRYQDAAATVYERLLALVKEKDYFVITTNVDHCFQKAGFDKKRLFYTQGDYGLFQCSRPCHQSTYDNEETIRKMVEAQGYIPGGVLTLPEGKKPGMTVPAELVPHCPKCGEPMSMNLRADGTFVEDVGWHDAAERYTEFLSGHKSGKVLFLELGVGCNTPGIIKYSFWQMTKQQPGAVYACINLGEAYAPTEIEDRALCIDADIGRALERLEKA